MSKILLKDLLKYSFVPYLFVTRTHRLNISTKKKTQKQWTNWVHRRLLSEQNLQPNSSIISTKSSTITFPNNTPPDIQEFFYFNKKILCFYDDTPNPQTPSSSPRTTDDSGQEEFLGKLKAFKIQIKNITLEDTPDLEVYYNNLKKELLKIIDKTKDVNLVITIMPKVIVPDKDNKKDILVGQNFDNEKNTIGLNVYASKVYTDVSEDLEVTILVLLEQIQEVQPALQWNLNLKSINTKFVEKKQTETVLGNKVSDKIIELCDGKEIEDHYFEGWEKIEINQIKNKSLNTFLLESSSNKNKKLLSYNKDTNKPSRFAGYFRQIGDNECEIIWEPQWEIANIDYNNVNQSEGDILHVTEPFIPDTKSPQITNLSFIWLQNMRTFENKINETGLENYKIYNVRGDNGNCFFYSFVNALIGSDILTKEQFGIPEKFEHVQEEEAYIRPVYVVLANRLRILASTILKNSFTTLHNNIKTNIDLFNGEDYPLEENKEIFTILIKQRLTLTEDIDDSLSPIQKETEIHRQVLNYLTKIKQDKFWGSDLEFEALCSFFYVDGKIFSLGSKPNLNIVEINKEQVRIKFPIGDDVTLDDIESPAVPSDKTIYISLLENHFMGTIPISGFKLSSYNYLFQNNELKVEIDEGKKIQVTDFHEGGQYADQYSNLEKWHSYIQWLFPNKGKTIFGPKDSQTVIFWEENKFIVPEQLVLNEYDIKFIQDSDSAKINSIKTLITILKFLGFRLVNETDDTNIVIGSYDDFKRALTNIKMSKLADESIKKERFVNLLKKTHNYKRISRILDYFKSIGLLQLSQIIVLGLQQEIEPEDGGLQGSDEIKRSLNDFWKTIVN